MISLKGFTSGASNNKADSTPTPSQDAPQPKGTVFSSAMPKQAKKKETATYLESKNKKKAYLNLALATLILGVYSYSFLYENAVAYINAPEEIARLQSQNEEYEDTTIPFLEATRDEHKEGYDDEFEEVINALDTVFPVGIDKLGIVSLFEDFAAEVDAIYPPFEFTSINLSTPVEREGYVVVPVSTSIHSSLAGFDSFLSLIEKSGQIYASGSDDKTVANKLVRLMSVSNISVNYRGTNEETGKDEGVDFSVRLDVYSRPTANTNQ